MPQSRLLDSQKDYLFFASCKKTNKDYFPIFVVAKSIKIVYYGIFIEAATRGLLWKKMFLEISQNSQENGLC